LHRVPFTIRIERARVQRLNTRSTEPLELHSKLERQRVSNGEP
jgi:hypothetical protein